MERSCRGSTRWKAATPARCEELSSTIGFVWSGSIRSSVSRPSTTAGSRARELPSLERGRPPPSAGERPARVAGARYGTTKRRKLLDEDKLAKAFARLDSRPGSPLRRRIAGIHRRLLRGRGRAAGRQSAGTGSGRAGGPPAADSQGDRARSAEPQAVDRAGQRVLRPGRL